MDINVPKPDELTDEQKRKALKIILGDELDLYEEYVMKLSDDDQDEYFSAHSEFMREYPISRERIYLLKDKTFREILRKIKQFEKFSI